MTSLYGAVPINLEVDENLTLDEEGLLLKEGGTDNELVKTTAPGDVAVGVLDQAVVDVEQNARDTRDGEQVGVFPLGSGAIVNVRSTGDAFNVGDPVYVGQSADTDGYASSDSSNSAVKIGHYVGEGTSGSSGELIHVQLDEPISN
jgi:hypothetical protein